MSGRFFVIEGLNGCGRTTQLDYLKYYLRRKKREVVPTKEPDCNTEIGKIIRKILDGVIRMSEKEIQKLFIKNRQEHLIDIIEPVIRLGGDVISDGYYWSTIAFGTGAGGLDMNVLIKMNFSFRSPDFTFFLNVPVGLCLERIGKKRGTSTHFETKEKMVGAQKVFLELAEMFPDKIAVIDGEQKEEDVADYITTIINQKNLI